MSISYFEGTFAITSPEKLYSSFLTDYLKVSEPIEYKQDFAATRANAWYLVDFDGDGVRDLVVGASDWTEYGWDNAFNEKGEWTRGPLHGHVYFMRNTGSNEAPKYADSVRIEAGGKPLDVYGRPSPSFQDWDGDGDLDLICGEFLDRLTYFENTGSRTEPQYAEGKFLTHGGEVIRMDLEMIVPVAFDWDLDGDMDLIVGDEDGRVALIEKVEGKEEGVPAFLPPKYFQQEAHEVKVGALVTPVGVDWDSDGDQDLVCGNTAGYLVFVENLSGGENPKWARPVDLEAEGETVRIQAGPNGSIQGPCEAKWGYTVPAVADWNHDGLLDIVINSIWGEILWYENIGEEGKPALKKSRPIEVEWEGETPKPAWFWWNPEGDQLVTQWRTTPFVHDWNGDGLNDLVMLDTEGYLAFFERKKEGEKLVLLPGERIFRDNAGNPLRLNSKIAGGSGRRKIVLTDWDGDGKTDILVNSRNIDFLRNISKEGGPPTFRNLGELDDRQLAGHSTSPTVVDWDGNGIPDLLIGAEDGYFYHVKNPRSAK
jgi:hypothetical protein